MKISRSRSSSMSSSPRELANCCGSMKDKALLRSIGARSSAQRVDGFEAGRRNQPGPRIFGNAALLLYVQRSGKSLLHGVLCEIEIPEQADQTREDSARIGPV